MKELLNLRGIVTVINTPFTNQDTIDIIGLERNVEYAIDSGVSGFLIPGMASEVSKLSIKEQEQIVSTLLTKNNKNKCVIGGCYGNSNEERIEIAKKWLDFGCNGLLINIPYENNPNFMDEFKKFASLDPPFLMLQDWSEKGYGIPTNIIIKLWQEIDCFKSIKVEVVPAGIKYNRRSNAVELFNEILPVLAFSNQHLDISIHFFKRLLYQQGIYSTPNVRKPILDFDKVHARIADELIKKIMEITKLARAK